MEWKAPSKRNFFEGLDRLDESDDSDDGGDSLEQLAALRPLKVTNPAASKVSVLPEPQPGILARARTEPELSASQKQLKPAEVKKVETKHPRRTEQPSAVKVNPVQRFHTTGSMPGTKTAGPTSKKRKASNVKIVSEDQQIFKELVFCKSLHETMLDDFG